MSEKSNENRQSGVGRHDIDPTDVLLAVDVGNSLTNLGLFNEGNLVSTWTVTTPALMTPDEARACVATFFNALTYDKKAVVQEVHLTDGIVASVVPDLTDAWLAAIRSMCGRAPLVVGPGVKTGIKMRYNDPGELGADRMADLVAAKATYEPPFVVVDLGTTTNFEIVDKDGVFIGGVIAPGLKLSAKAVTDAAARLAVVDLKAPASIVGKNTCEAMQAGIVMGEVARIDGLINLMWDELGYETNVVVTGSDAATLAALSQRIEEVDEHLTLRGLHLLYALNRRS